MAGQVPKLAPKTVKNRSSTPLMEWIRSKLLAVDRKPGTGTPGLPTPDGKAVYQPHQRFPNTQSIRSPEPPLAQGGIHHKLADNYYYDRDARRMIEPPKPFVKAKEGGVVEYAESKTGEVFPAEKVKEQILAINKGLDQNFGLPKTLPIPGAGYVWKRNIDEEEHSMKKDKDLEKIAKKYDAYSNLQR